MEKYAAEHILGLAGEYDARLLKAAFHERAARYHPDAAKKHGLNPAEATSKMQEVNEANDYLEKLLAQWGPTLSCESAPASADDPQHRGIPWAPPVPHAAAAYNPFEGHRPDGANRRKRTTTAEYYWNGARSRARADRSRPHDATTADHEPVYYNGEYESFSGQPQPEPKEDPAHPFPKWYLKVWRFFAIFPYRFLFLLLACLFVNLSDPLGAGKGIGFISFEDAIILVAIVNLVKPFLTAPIRWAALWLVDRARDLAWSVRAT